jgi:hypothetical protein
MPSVVPERVERRLVGEVTPLAEVLRVGRILQRRHMRVEILVLAALRQFFIGMAHIGVSVRAGGMGVVAIVRHMRVMMTAARNVRIMRYRYVVPAADVREMRDADVPAAPAVTTASAAPAMAASATSSAAASTAAATTTSTALGERHIRRAKCNPQRTDTAGKSQDDKPSGKLFADRIHDFVFPWKKAFPLAHRQRDCDARVPRLRNCDAALHR